VTARELPAFRVPGYLGALRAGLTSLAPNLDFVPLREALGSCALLDPAVSGELALPAELAECGLPSTAWLLRGAGALTAAVPVSAAELARARRLDAEVAARMEARARLAELKASGDRLPSSRLRGAVRRRGATTDFLLTFDRLVPDGRWLRLRVDLTGPAGWETSGPIRLNTDGSVRLHEGLQHLVGRHLLTPLGAVASQLQDGTGAMVTRLSRGMVGPFWFPGQPLPDGVPAALAAGLVLHASLEVLARDLRDSADQDPLGAPLPPLLPDGMGLARSRRFAASPGMEGPLRAWAEEKGCAVTVARLVPG